MEHTTGGPAFEGLNFAVLSLVGVVEGLKEELACCMEDLRRERQERQKERNRKFYHIRKNRRNRTFKWKPVSLPYSMPPTSENTEESLHQSNIELWNSHPDSFTLENDLSRSTRTDPDHPIHPTTVTRTSTLVTSDMKILYDSDFRHNYHKGYEHAEPITYPVDKTWDCLEKLFPENSNDSIVFDEENVLKSPDNSESSDTIYWWEPSFEPSRELSSTIMESFIKDSGELNIEGILEYYISTTRGSRAPIFDDVVMDTKFWLDFKSFEDYLYYRCITKENLVGKNIVFDNHILENGAKIWSFNACVLNYDPIEDVHLVQDESGCEFKTNLIDDTSHLWLLEKDFIKYSW